MLTPYGEWVRAFRKRENITLREMARTLGRSPSFLSAIELGKKSVPESLVGQFEAAYELQGEEKERLKLLAHTSRVETRVRFAQEAGAKEREVAMLFARIFDDLTEDQTERIRNILEERNDRLKR